MSNITIIQGYKSIPQLTRNEYEFVNQNKKRGTYNAYNVLNISNIEYELDFESDFYGMFWVPYGTNNANINLKQGIENKIFYKIQTKSGDSVEYISGGTVYKSGGLSYSKSFVNNYNVITINASNPIGSYEFLIQVRLNNKDYKLTAVINLLEANGLNEFINFDDPTGPTEVFGGTGGGIFGDDTDNENSGWETEPDDEGGSGGGDNPFGGDDFTGGVINPDDLKPENNSGYLVSRNKVRFYENIYGRYNNADTWVITNQGNATFNSITIGETVINSSTIGNLGGGSCSCDGNQIVIISLDDYQSLSEKDPEIIYMVY